MVLPSVVSAAVGAVTTAACVCAVVVTGLMNDFFTDCLLSNFVGFTSLGGRQSFTSLPRFFSLTGRQMRTIQADVFLPFVNNRNRSHAFLLGSRTHWVAAVANKVNGRLEVAFMDSANKVCAVWLWLFVWVHGVTMACWPEQPIVNRSHAQLVDLAMQRTLASRATSYMQIRWRKAHRDKTDAEVEDIFMNGAPTARRACVPYDIGG